MSVCHITDHAYFRAKKRLGVKPRSLDRTIDRIFDQGIAIYQTRGSLFQYLMRLQEKNHAINQLRIYGDNLYLFADHTLVTVYQLPSEHQHTVARIRQRWIKQCA